MILSNEGIRLAIEQGQLEIDPEPVDDQYTTSAVDLLLGGSFQLWDQSLFKPPGIRIELNLADQEFQKTAQAFLTKPAMENDGSVILPPYNLASCLPLLAMTRERVHLKHGSLLAARVEGRSSFARLGLSVHLTAPTIHSGFNAPITLEMINHGPFHLKLVPGRTRICQLIVERLESQPDVPIATIFQGQVDPSGRK